MVSVYVWELRSSRIWSKRIGWWVWMLFFVLISIYNRLDTLYLCIPPSPYTPQYTIYQVYIINCTVECCSVILNRLVKSRRSRLRCLGQQLGPDPPKQTRSSPTSAFFSRPPDQPQSGLALVHQTAALTGTLSAIFPLVGYSFRPGPVTRPDLRLDPTARLEPCQVPTVRA